MLALFRLLNARMGNIWDEALIRLIGQSQALVLFWVLLRFGFQDVFAQADTFRGTWQSVSAYKKATESVKLKFQRSSDFLSVRLTF